MREHRALDALLDPGGITPVYQPIVRMHDGTTSVAGFECLSRGPRGTNFETANVLFDYVRLKREETLIDRACVAAALASAPHAEVRLSVNVHASTLGRDAEFIGFLEKQARTNQIPLDRVTVEIVEHAPPWDGVGFLTALERLRELGVRIALDDVGLGQSNFKMMLDVRPDYLKIDAYFVDSCDVDGDRQAVLRALGSLATHFGAELVAEGVERPSVVDMLLRYGITLMQGFLFSRPLSAARAAELVGVKGVTTVEFAPRLPIQRV